MTRACVWTACLGAAAMAACAAESEPAGNAELGVAEFRVTATESSLTIVGVDGSGGVAARLYLRTGVVQPPDFDAPTLGRALEVEVHGVPVEPFLSAGLEPLQLPPPGDPALAAFLFDPFVKPLLAVPGLRR